MSFLDTIKAKAGEESWVHLEAEANKEVAMASQMPLLNQGGLARLYTQRFLLGELLPECERFERAGLKILPTEVLSVLFRCKLLFAAHTEQEYVQRSGGIPLFNSAAIPRWTDKAEKVDVLVDRYITRLGLEIRERTLLTEINSFSPSSPAQSPQASFEHLFLELGFPFVCFFDDGHLVEKHRQFEPGLGSYDQTGATRYFSAPSIGFRTSGSGGYCFWYSSMWLRTFLDMLRIAGYIHPGQRDFGFDAKMTAPTNPVFLGDHSQGGDSWHEDMKEPWAKISDGCLFRSFGYRGLSNMWLDLRSLPGIRKFMLGHKKIFEGLNNPWNPRNINDVAPALEILSSATQIPDVGAKILQVYCCLEHFFVPKNTNGENKKYIIGGMNALAPDLIPWFDQLYKLRCAYAHKGFVQPDANTPELIAASVKNAMTLLVAKLTASPSHQIAGA
jgi:hypothetical protein